MSGSDLQRKRQEMLEAMCEAADEERNAFEAQQPPAEDGGPTDEEEE